MANKATKAAAGVAGKAKEAGTARSGQSGILRHLAGEHGEVATLMQRIVNSPGASDAREDLFSDLKRNLLAHVKSEEKIFYPALETHPELRELVETSLEQHDQVEEMLELLSSNDKGTKIWLRDFERLKQAVEEHVELEEEQIFPRATDLYSKDQLGEMLEEYEEEEEAIKDQLD